MSSRRSKYFVQKRKNTRLDDEEDDYDLDKPDDKTLYVDGPPEPVDTGLVTVDGDPIYRDAIEPIGFIRFE